MANWDDVRQLALALPDTSERDARGGTQWRVHEKLFVWERPLRAREAQELGKDVPHGPILAARVEHLGVKDALLGDDPNVYFTTSHFHGYAAILVRLQLIHFQELHELVIDAWLARAPKRLAQQYLDSHPLS